MGEEDPGPTFVDDDGRAWYPDPTGRHRLRARIGGTWSNLVRVDRSSDVAEDPQGGRELRSGLGESKPSPAPRSTSGSGCGLVVAFLVLAMAFAVATRSCNDGDAGGPTLDPIDDLELEADGAGSGAVWSGPAMDGSTVRIVDDGGDTGFSEGPDGQILPGPIAMIEGHAAAGDCEALARDISQWSGVRMSSSAGVARASAYLRHALDRAAQVGC